MRHDVRRHRRPGRLDPVQSPRARLAGLLVAETIVTLGSRVAAMAVPWLVLITTGSPAKMGVIAAAEAVPFVLSSVFGAPLIDRIGVRRVILTAIAGGAVTTAAVAAGYRAGLGVLAVLVAVNGALRGVGDRARALLLKPTVQAAKVQLTRATAAYDGISKLSMLIGAPIGGVLIAWLGVAGVLWAHAVTMVAGAVLMYTQARQPVEGPPPTASSNGAAPGPAGNGAAPAPASRSGPAPGPAGNGAARAPVGFGRRDEPYLRALRGGFAYMWRDRLLFSMAVMTLVTNLCTAASATVFIPLWVNEVLRTPAGLGLVSGAFALGALVGNIGFTALAPRLPRYLTLTIGYLVGSSPRFLILGISDDLTTAMAVFFTCGIAVSSFNPIIGVMLYQRVPAQLQARVFGVSAALSYGGMPLGSFLGGLAAERFGFTTALLIAAIVAFGATLIPVVGYRTWRQLDDADESSLAPTGTPDCTRTPTVAGRR
jgi:MFS family permease